MTVQKFVIQEHTKSGCTHWDLMLQKGDFLETWRLDKEPIQIQIQNAPAKAEKIFDHPLKFLTYEGPVNKGKGSVKIADAGTCKITDQNASTVEMELAGQILKGKFTLTSTTENGWEFRSGKQG